MANVKKSWVPKPWPNGLGFDLGKSWYVLNPDPEIGINVFRARKFDSHDNIVLVGEGDTWQSAVESAAPFVRSDF